MRGAPKAGPFARVPEELLDHPWRHVVVLTPEGMVHTGRAMLRHAYCNGGLKMEGALIRTMVQNGVYMPGGEADPLEVQALPNAAMVVACNANGHILMYAGLSGMGDEARKIYPNYFADPQSSAAISAIEVSRSIWLRWWGSTTSL